MTRYLPSCRHKAMGVETGLSLRYGAGRSYMSKRWRRCATASPIDHMESICASRAAPPLPTISCCPSSEPSCSRTCPAARQTCGCTRGRWRWRATACPAGPTRSCPCWRSSPPSSMTSSRPSSWSRSAAIHLSPNACVGCVHSHKHSKKSSPRTFDQCAYYTCIYIHLLWRLGPCSLIDASS